MISGRFGSMGELFFEIDLITAEGEAFQVDALLDTGFTTGWLAVNSQDIDGLGWLVIERNRAMRTAQGQDVFDLYEGTVSIDGVEYRIPVHLGEEIPDHLRLQRRHPFIQGNLLTTPHIRRQRINHHLRLRQPRAFDVVSQTLVEMSRNADTELD